MKPIIGISDEREVFYNHLLSELTQQEWTVLLHLVDDFTNAEIAEKLCVTSESVENYRTRIGCKLNLKGHHALARFARKYAQELRSRCQSKCSKTKLSAGLNK